MEKFNVRLLVSQGGSLEGEIFENTRFGLPLTLFWKVSIPLEDFTIRTYQVCNPTIELGAFILPYQSVSDFRFRSDTLRSWKDLPGKTFDFSGSTVDNIGSAYYNVIHHELQDHNCSLLANVADEAYDNVIEIHKMEFGKLDGNRICAKLQLQMHFDAFNVHKPPFATEIYGEIFDFEVELNLHPVRLLHTEKEMNSISEAISLAEHAINIEDYEPKAIKQQAFRSLTERVDRTVYSFEPKCNDE
jgi:hypothetical protein